MGTPQELGLEVGNQGTVVEMRVHGADPEDVEAAVERLSPSHPKVRFDAVVGTIAGISPAGTLMSVDASTYDDVQPGTIILVKNSFVAPEGQDRLSELLRIKQVSINTGQNGSVEVWRAGRRQEPNRYFPKPNNRRQMR